MTECLLADNREPQAAQTSQLPADIPLRRGGGAPFTGNGLGVFQAFSLVLLLMLLCAWFLRRWRVAKGTQGRGPEQTKLGWSAWLSGPIRGSQVQLLESRRLTPKSSLHLVSWDGREWLIGCTDRAIEVIGQRPVGTNGDPMPRKEQA